MPQPKTAKWVIASSFPAKYGPNKSVPVNRIKTVAELGGYRTFASLWDVDAELKDAGPERCPVLLADY